MPKQTPNRPTPTTKVEGTDEALSLKAKNADVLPEDYEAWRSKRKTSATGPIVERSFHLIQARMSEAAAVRKRSEAKERPQKGWRPLVQTPAAFRAYAPSNALGTMTSEDFLDSLLVGIEHLNALTYDFAQQQRNSVAQDRQQVFKQLVAARRMRNEAQGDEK